MKIAVAGASGRMGRMLIEAIQQADDAVLAGALDIPGSPALGSDAAAFLGKPAGVKVESEFAAGLADAAFLIDFTRPEGTLQHLAFCAEHGIKMIIGTTGFDEAGKRAIRQAAAKTAILFAPNMSVGVNVTMKLLEMAAKSFSHGYDIEIIEAHHRHKVDAPSGTALLLGKAAAEGREVDLEGMSTRVRDGHTGARQTGTIGFATLRGGSVTGDHSVILAGEGERITLSHHAEDRAIFARGAVKAALWARSRKPGLYTMTDVLGLSAG